MMRQYYRNASKLISKVALQLALAFALVFAFGGCADKEAPVLRRDSGAVLIWPLGVPFTPTKAIAFDNQDLDISEKIEYTGFIDVNTPGMYSITYHVKDQAGNSTSLDQDVQVKLTAQSIEGNYASISSCDSVPGPGHSLFVADLGLDSVFFMTNLLREQTGEFGEDVKLVLFSDGTCLIVEPGDIPNSSFFVNVGSGRFSSDLDTLRMDVLLKSTSGSNVNNACSIIYVKQ